MAFQKWLNPMTFGVVHSILPSNTPFMKPIPYCLLILIVLSCAPGKDNHTAVDSTVVATDTTLAYTPPQYHPAPARNFPLFSSYPVTENEQEVSITDALTELLNQYDTAKYKTIKSEYTVYYKVASDYEGDSLDTSETETKTWYYSTTHELKAYSVAFEEKVGSSVYNPSSESKIGRSETIIYLFSSNSPEDPALVGVYKDKDTYYDNSISEKTRIITSKCPQCGVSFSYDSESTDEVEVLEQEYVSGLSTAFFEEYNSLLIFLKSAEMKKDNENYVAKEELAHVKPGSDYSIDYTYTVDYTINETLYKKLLKGNTL
jgi:hypothetical protein